MPKLPKHDALDYIFSKLTELAAVADESDLPRLCRYIELTRAECQHERTGVFPNPNNISLLNRSRSH